MYTQVETYSLIVGLETSKQSERLDITLVAVSVHPNGYRICLLKIQARELSYIRV